MVGGGAAVVFLGPSAPGRPNDLWSVAVDGSEPPVRLSRSVAGTAGIVSFMTDDVSGRTAFLSEVQPGVFELLSVGVGEPSSQRRLSPALAGNTVDAFGGPHGGPLAITAGGTVVFRMVPLDPGPSSLWMADIDGSTRPVRLSGQLHAWDFVVAADGSAVVFRATAPEGDVALYSAPLARRAALTRISSPGAGGVDLDNHLPVLSADGKWAGFLADLEEQGRLDLFTARIGVAGSQRLIAGGRPAGEGGITLFRAAADSADLVFLDDPHSPGVVELFSSPFDASAAPVALSTTAPAVAGSGAVWYFDLAGDGRVVYFGNLDTPNHLEMYSAKIGVPGSQIMLSSVELPSDEQAWVGFPFVSPDGARIAYSGMLTAETPELYGAPVDTEGAQVQLSDAVSDGTSVDYFVFAPDGSRIVYVGAPNATVGGALFSVLADGSEPRVELTATVVPGRGVRFGPAGLRLTPDSGWVLFAGDLDKDGVVELFAVPVHGSTDPIKVSRPTARPGTEAAIVDTFTCGGVFTHNRAKPNWQQLSVVTIPGCAS